MTEPAPERVVALRRARRLRGYLAQIPFLLVLLVIAAAALLVLFDRWRRGAFVFGAALILGAVLRAFLPSERAGLLQVRTKLIDTSMMTLAGAAIFWLAASIDSLGTD